MKYNRSELDHCNRDKWKSRVGTWDWIHHHRNQYYNRISVKQEFSSMWARMKYKLLLLHHTSCRSNDTDYKQLHLSDNIQQYRRRYLMWYFEKLLFGWGKLSSYWQHHQYKWHMLNGILRKFFLHRHNNLVGKDKIELHHHTDCLSSCKTNKLKCCSSNKSNMYGSNLGKYQTQGYRNSKGFDIRIILH